MDWTKKGKNAVDAAPSLDGDVGRRNENAVRGEVNESQEGTTLSNDGSDALKDEKRLCQNL